MLLYSYKNKNQIKFENLINNYSDIYRKTDLYDLKKKKFKKEKKKVWNSIVLELKNYSKFNKDKYIKLSLRKLRPYFVRRIEKKKSLVEYNIFARFGCFDYSIKNNKVDLHMPVFQFINHKKSKPKNYTYNQKFNMRAEDLRELVQDAKNKNPKIKIIQMGSWLNQYKPFRSLFPKTWRSTMKTKKKDSIAWWGQFIRSDGNINTFLYEQFKKKLKFKYAGKFYQCKIQDLKAYLEKIKYEKN